jgi:antitoxin VapB
MAGVGITDAIVMAMKEAIERRRADETPLETAARLRLKHCIQLKGTMREPLPRYVFDEIWKDN